jgi:hypothetical protein
VPAEIVASEPEAVTAPVTEEAPPVVETAVVEAAQALAHEPAAESTPAQAPTEQQIPVVEAQTELTPPQQEPELQPVSVVEAMAVFDPAPAVPATAAVSTAPEPIVSPEGPAAVEAPPAVLPALATTVETEPPVGSRDLSGYAATFDPQLQAELRAVAEAVAKAAEVTPAVPPEPVSSVPVAMAVPPPPLPTAAESAPPVEGEAPYTVPARIATARQAPDAFLWIMFGSSAVFLGIVWIAIYFSMH